MKRDFRWYDHITIKVYLTASGAAFPWCCSNGGAWPDSITGEGWGKGRDSQYSALPV
jgi:hypothetical protein